MAWRSLAGNVTTPRLLMVSVACMIAVYLSCSNSVKMNAHPQELRQVWNTVRQRCIALGQLVVRFANDLELSLHSRLGHLVGSVRGSVHARSKWLNCQRSVTHILQECP